MKSVVGCFEFVRRKANGNDCWVDRGFRLVNESLNIVDAIKLEGQYRESNLLRSE